MCSEYLMEEIERQTQYNVVQIEVSFVSTGLDCLSTCSCYLYEHCVAIKHFR